MPNRPLCFHTVVYGGILLQRFYPVKIFIDAVPFVITVEITTINSAARVTIIIVGKRSV